MSSIKANVRVTQSQPIRRIVFIGVRRRKRDIYHLDYFDIIVARWGSSVRENVTI